MLRGPRDGTRVGAAHGLPFGTATPEEANPLEAALGVRGTTALRRVLHWTNGHPYLTQRLCREIVSRGAATPREVDRLCERKERDFASKFLKEDNAALRKKLRKVEIPVEGKYRELDKDNVHMRERLRVMNVSVENEGQVHARIERQVEKKMERVTFWWHP